MYRNYLKTNLLACTRITKFTRCKTQALDIEKLESDDTLELEVDEDRKLRDIQLEKERNKSRLNTQHRNILNNKVPFNEPKHWSHGTLRYQRKMFGKYGNESNVDASLCWPTKEELRLAKEYEGIAHPFTIPEMVNAAKTKRAEKEKRISDRQELIAKNLEKLEKWKSDLMQKVEKKEAEAIAAKNRKDRLIEEVRRHFGYTVDLKDDRFKEMLEKKEKEQRKQMKEARKKAKEDKLIDKLLSKTDETSTESTENTEKN